MWIIINHMDQAEEGIMSRRDLGEEEPQSAEGRSERSLVRKKGQVPGLAAKVERKVSKRREANE